MGACCNLHGCVLWCVQYYAAATALLQ